MASWQKPHIEKNHEYIRYVVPKGRNLNPYRQEDITLLMNHINSTKRYSLKGKAPYELIEEDDEDMRVLMDLLKQRLAFAEYYHISKYQELNQCLEQLPDGSNMDKDIWDVEYEKKHKK